MARVRIHLADARGEGLPPVCMCCGAPAALYKRQQFIWAPFWSYLLGPLGYRFYWRARMDGPLCAAHRYHWTWRWAVPLCLLVIGIATAAGCYIYLDITRGQPVAHAWRGWICGCGAVAFAVWFIFFQILRRTGVHPVRIDASSITFAGVADAFAEAMENPTPSALPARGRAAKRAIIQEVLPADELEGREWRRDVSR
ncbi:MAG TPA: hypothetical protein VGZ47_03985 [Gemmataceae bacterium]|jgi:hypothetical protein|nr:hypothetical protein [Gemmataceae bacterium]